MISEQEKVHEIVTSKGPQKYVFFATELGLQEVIRNQGACDIVMLKESTLNTKAAIVIKEGVPYKNTLSQT